MDELTENLSSPVWWLCVVVVGVPVNLLSGFLKPGLDAGLWQVSRRWSERSVKRRVEHQAFVRSLTGDAHRQVMASCAEVRNRLRCLLHMVLSAAFFAADVSAADMGRGIEFIYALSSACLLLAVLNALSGVRYQMDALVATAGSAPK